MRAALESARIAPAAEPTPVPAALDAVPRVVTTRSGPVECAITGSGPTVLALHGAMGGWDQGVLLARTAGVPGYRYLAPSRPGYLGTPLGKARTPAEQALLYRDLLDALGVERVAVMAVSGGGPSALQFAADHPDRCWALVVASSVCRRVDRHLPLAWHVLRLAMHWRPVADSMRRRAEKDPARATRRSIPNPRMRARTLADPEAGPLLRALELSTLDRMDLRMPGTENDVATTRGDLALPLERIRAPLLVVHGTEDELAPFSGGMEMATRVPRAEILAIEGGRHVTIYTHRDRVRSDVARFLAEHAPPRATA